MMILYYFFLFPYKTSVATHWKHLGEAFLMNTYNVRFYGELEKTIQINVFFINKSTDYTTNKKRQKQNKKKKKTKKKQKNNVLYHIDSKRAGASFWQKNVHKYWSTA